MKAKKFTAVVLMAVALLVFVAGCTLTPIHARTIEEIRGTYAISEYYVKVGDGRTDLMDCFEYFYLIIGDEGVSAIVYKQAGAEEYYARETGYTLKYDSGSTTKINEIKLRFEIPGDDEVTYINYLTVSQKNSLVCVKAGYVYDDNGKKLHKAVYMSVKKVSAEVGYDYVEEQIGYEITDIQTPYGI